MKERNSNSLKCGNYSEFARYYANLLRRFKTLLFIYVKRLFALITYNILRKINLNKFNYILSRFLYLFFEYLIKKSDIRSR